MQEEPAAPSIAAQVISERTHLLVPSLPHWIEPTVDYLRQKAIACGACHESRAGKLMIALLEALSNAVVHGNLQISSALKESGDDTFARTLAERAADPVFSARVVDIRVDYDSETCRWIITDEGPGFDVEHVLKRCLSDDPEVMLASGRGILMMHSFLDGVRYDLGGRRLTLTLNRPSGAEKRRERRVPMHEPLRVAPLRADGTPDLAAATTAVASDLSQRGAALIQASLVAGQHVYIGIPAGGETVYVRAAVRHCRTLAEGCVQLGCEFEVAPGEPESAQESGELHGAVLALLARHEAPAAPSDERRAHPRVTFNQLVAMESEGREPVTGYARDLSRGGMAIITRVPVALGAVVVRLPRDKEPPLGIRSRVVRCNRIAEGYHDVGLQFLRLASSADSGGG
jgi:anti-sigma regulatory factor (Ser/Thr protein kinase)